MDEHYSIIESKFYHKILLGIAKRVIKFLFHLFISYLDFFLFLSNNYHEGHNWKGENVSEVLQSFTSA